MTLHSARFVALASLLISMALVELSIAEDRVDFDPALSFLELPSDVALGPCSAVDFDSKGRLFLFHRGKQPILCFDRNGKLLHSWGDDLIGKAHGLRIDNADNVWVTDIGHHMVFKFSPEGKLLLALGQADKPGLESDQFNQPTDVAFGPKGEIYVSDGYGNSRVMKFAPSGKFLAQWGVRGKGQGEFHLPHAMVVDAQGRILVGDRENDRIQVFDSEGNFLESWPGFAPYGMEFDSKGALFVTDGRANKVLRLDSSGKVVGSWGGKGNGPGEFNLPHMLAADSEGNLYIAEVGGKRLQKLVRKPRLTNSASQNPRPNDALIESITKVTLRQNRDGSGTTWFHPRACMIPSASGKPTALMTLQEIAGSDYFGPVHWSESQDGGETWSDPKEIPSLGRIPVEGHPGLMAGVCDVVPEYHPQTGTVLALGHVVFYRGPRFAKGDQLARYPVYAVRRKDGTWSERKILRWDDPRGANIYTNNCGQRVVLPNGDILMSFTFGPTGNNRMVAGVKCSFDGEELKVLEVGPPLTNNVGRGLLEPSVTAFRGRYYLTLRAEDGRGYVAVSDDGLNYQNKTAWAFDDGTPVGMSTTQQHWLAHSEGLFLVYTRKDSSNANVLRWRSPLWMARVDPEKLCLIRDSETIVLPLVGDGVKAPDDVAIMGNFHVTSASPEESWVSVGEWMPRRNAKGDLLLARIRWTRPNTLAPKFTK